MNRQFEFEVLAECQQFYVHDEMADFELLDWTRQASNRLLAVSPDAISVGTIRGPAFVPVVLELSDKAPGDDLNQWDQVNECSFKITSGHLVVGNVFCGGNRIEDRRIPVEPCAYRARIYYGNLASVTRDGIGEDHYRVVLWPAVAAPMQVLRQMDVQLLRWASFVADSSLSHRLTM